MAFEGVAVEDDPFSKEVSSMGSIVTVNL